VRLLKNDVFRIAFAVAAGLSVYLLLGYALDGEITAGDAAQGLLILCAVTGGVEWRRRHADDDLRPAGAALVLAGFVLIAVAVIFALTAS
jgi:hypothetical protein